MPITAPAYPPTPAQPPRHHHQRRHVPRLNLDVTNPPRHHDDVNQRRAFTDRDDYYYHHHHHYQHNHPRTRWSRGPAREQVLSARDSTYGFDRDFVHDYHQARLPGGHPGARVSLYTHDSSDPYSCTCYPRKSQKTIPSMMYDEVRCPHPEHRFQPGEQDLFAYPWTSQTYRPHVALERGYKRGQVKPPSAVTAPPFVLYNAKERNPGRGPHPPPYTAPEGPPLSPLLSADPSDRRLRRVDRRRLAAFPPLPPVGEEEFVSPFDSVSQQMTRRSFRRPSLRLRTVDSAARLRVESELRGTRSRLRARSTPRALPTPLDADGFPGTPNRIFKGEYVDPNGEKYQYDIKYGKNSLEGQRRRLRTI